MERRLTCIVCPLGCEITVCLNGDGIIESIDGYTCKRGKAYAETECTDPRRTVTSTVKTDKGIPVSVKTETPIPKDKIDACMAVINRTRVTLPVRIGDVVIEDLFGSRLVVTQNMGE